jgi:hypothetical protein
VTPLFPYFDIDLLSQGILPVLVIAENHHSKASFLLEKKQFYILKRDGHYNESEIFAQNREPLMPYSKEDLERTKAAASVIGFIPLFPSSIVLGSIIEAGSGKRLKDVKLINRNLRKKAFIDRSIFPGEVNSGFVYFQMREETAISAISTMSTRVTNILLDKELSFDFKIEQ